MKAREVVKERLSFLENEQMINDVENVIYEMTCDFCKDNNIDLNTLNIKFVQTYIDFSRQMVLNIDKESYIKNTLLSKQLKSGKISVDKLTDVYKIHGKWNKYKEDLKILKKEQSNFNTQMNTTEDQFTCSKCKRKTKCCYTSVQTRSSDEPMTNFVTCLECNHNWRE